MGSFWGGFRAGSVSKTMHLVWEVLQKWRVHLRNTASGAIDFYGEGDARQRQDPNPHKHFSIPAEDNGGKKVVKENATFQISHLVEHV